MPEPVPEPPAPKDEAVEMERLALEKFERAQAEHAAGNLFDAMQLAEESRTILEALATLYEQRGADAGAARDRIQRANDFLTLCRKPSAPPAAPEEKQVEPKAEAAPPAPPKEAEKPRLELPKDPEKEFRAAFAAWLKAPETPPPALRPEGGAVALALYAVASGLRHQEWTTTPEEFAALRRYADAPETDSAAFAQLAAELSQGRAKNLRFPAVRILALGHLEQIHARGPIEPLLLRHSAELELSPDGFAVEGEAAEKIMAALGELPPAEFDKLARSFDSIREPAYKIFRTIAYVCAVLEYKGEAGQAAVGLALGELGKGGACAATRPLVAEWKSILPAYKGCKWCRGSHQVKCDFGCDEEGQVTKKCSVCNGTGRKPGYNLPYPCPERCPRGHTWKDPCPRCHGTRAQPCRSCKAPWQEPAAEKIMRRKPCTTCRSGLIFFKLLCPDCHGIGRVVSGPKKK
jgi:hypothetical protein